VHTSVAYIAFLRFLRFPGAVFCIPVPYSVVLVAIERTQAMNDMFISTCIEVCSIKHFIITHLLTVPYGMALSISTKPAGFSVNADNQGTPPSIWRVMVD